jgi:hypothetical protein
MGKTCGSNREPLSLQWPVHSTTVTQTPKIKPF